MLRRFTILGIAVLASFPPAVRADLHFDSSAVDRGEVYRGPTLVQRFPFANRGPHPVEITATRGSCGCLKPRLSKPLLRPGENGWLEMEVNTLSQPEGPNSWRVRVTYRDGGQPAEAVVQLSARLIAEIDVVPAAINIVCGPRSLFVRDHDIAISNRRSKPLTITSAHASSPYIVVQLKEPIIAAKTNVSQAIHLRVGENYPEGKHDEVLSIGTNDAAYRELKVPLTILKHGREHLSVSPPCLRFDGPANQPLPSRIALLRGADDKAIIIEQVTSDDPAFVCTWAQGPNTMVTLKVQVDPDRLNGRTSLQAVLHVRVRAPAPQVVEVPLEVSLK